MLLLEEETVLFAVPQEQTSRSIVTIGIICFILRVCWSSNIILFFGVFPNLSIFAIRKGALAEWLGAGLQNLSQWFDSATHLSFFYLVNIVSVLIGDRLSSPIKIFGFSKYNLTYMAIVVL